LHVLNAQPAELLAADAVIEQGGQYRPIAHTFEGIVGRRVQKLAGLGIADAGVLPSLLLEIGRLTPSTGLPATALRSHR
jgi:hypothetical protein